MAFTTSSLSEALRAVRGTRTQESVAKDMGLRAQRYQAYEVQIRTPSVDAVRPLAKFMGISSDACIGLVMKDGVEVEVQTP